MIHGTNTSVQTSASMQRMTTLTLAKPMSAANVYGHTLALVGT